MCVCHTGQVLKHVDAHVLGALEPWIRRAMEQRRNSVNNREVRGNPLVGLTNTHTHTHAPPVSAEPIESTQRRTSTYIGAEALVGDLLDDFVLLRVVVEGTEQQRRRRVLEHRLGRVQPTRIRPKGVNARRGTRH